MGNKPLDPRAKMVEKTLFRLDLSERWLAERLGVNQGSVNRWLKGEQTPRDPGIWTQMLTHLRTYEKEAMKSGEVQTRETSTIIIPLYGGISASPMSAETADVELIEIPNMNTGRTTWARRVSGMSMTPLLEPGDIVVFDDRSHEPGQIVHAWDDGADAVKVITGHGQEQRLRSINQDFPDIDRPLRGNIKGVAVMRIRKLPYEEEQINKYPHGMRWRFEPFA